MKVKLKKDFILKAGEEFSDAPVKTKRYGAHYELLVAFGKDYCAQFIVDEELVKAHPDIFEITE